MKYDIDYFERTLRLNSSTAEKISAIRWNFVNLCDAKHVLDFGAGIPWFRVFRPAGVEVDTYDIGVAPQTGITRERYDLITFWDVLEHLEDLTLANAMISCSKWVAVTVPILPPGILLHEWKHYKPGEHICTFTDHSIIEFFDKRGFELGIKGHPECEIRSDIGSYLFGRK